LNLRTGANRAALSDKLALMDLTDTIAAAKAQANRPT
jgi:hypothetical protein